VQQPQRGLALSRRWETSFANSSAWRSLVDLPEQDNNASHEPSSNSTSASATAASAVRGSTLSMDLSHDGSELSSGNGDHNIRVWSLSSADARLRHTMQGHRRTPCCLRYHPLLTHLLASADLAGSVRIWDTRTGTQLVEHECAPPHLPLSERERVPSISWFPSASQICVGFVYRKRCFLWMLLDTNVPISVASPSFPTTVLQLSSAALTGASPFLGKRVRPSPPAEVDDAQKLEADAPSTKRSRLENGLAAATTNAATESCAGGAEDNQVCYRAPVLSWPQLSARLRGVFDGSGIAMACPLLAATVLPPPKPISLLKAPEPYRFISFHSSGEMLLLAERSVPLADELAAADALGYPKPGLSLNIFSLTRESMRPPAEQASAHPNHATAPCAEKEGSAPAPRPAQHHRPTLTLLATLRRLLFFSDSGVAVHEHRMAICQWHSPDAALSNQSVSASSASPSAAAAVLQPSLAIFDLRPSHVGTCLVRVSLDPCSFADLTCLAWMPSASGNMCGSNDDDGGGGYFIAAAYQVSTERSARRQRLRAMQRATGPDDGNQRVIDVPDSRRRQSANNTHNRLRPPHFDSRMGASTIGGNRSRLASTLGSMLSHLTDDEETIAQQRAVNAVNFMRRAATATSAAPPSEAPAAAIATDTVADAPAAATEDADAVARRETLLRDALEEHTFLSIYRSSDLSLAAQYTTGIGVRRDDDDDRMGSVVPPMATLKLHSSNAMLVHPDPAVGILLAAVNGDIHVCTPAPLHEEEAEPAARATTTMQQQQQRDDAVPLSGRHRLPDYVRAAVNRTWM
jgi:hypothetical protein